MCVNLQGSVAVTTTGLYTATIYTVDQSTIFWMKRYQIAIDNATPGAGARLFLATTNNGYIADCPGVVQASENGDPIFAVPGSSPGNAITINCYGYTTTAGTLRAIIGGYLE